MNSRSRFVAEVPHVRRIQNIHWLVLEEDREHTGGWYLYGHQDLDEGSDFDSWHLTRSEAQQEASTRWGINECDWKSDV